MSADTIFITGASTGIGLASATMLSQLGFKVVAGVLPSEDTAALKSANVTVFPLDITKHDMVYDVAEKLKKQVGDKGLYGLFNNAGIAVSGPLEFLPMEEIHRVMDVNLFGHVAVTQALLPLIRQAKGRIVNTTSMLGRVTSAFSGPYCMSKYAMEAFSDALRQELLPLGVHVSIIEPGSITTPIWGKFKDQSTEMLDELPPEGRYLYAEKFKGSIDAGMKWASTGIPPSMVAKKVCHAFTAKKPKAAYIVGTDTHQALLAKRLLPRRWFDALLRTRFDIK
jgi:NAD(P)-dependent dehydrogenase (short-subunit alcohol dehydrogenase family)